MKNILIWLKRFVTAALVVAGLALSWAGYLRLTGNVHEVEGGKLYRSGQLSGDHFRRIIVKHGIRTVINLRGKNKSKPWYDEEVASIGETGANHVDFSISANQELTQLQLAQLSSILKEAEQPVLIHCEAGADRSGLVSALYELWITKKSASVASSQLSFRFGHFPWLGSRSVAMDRTFYRVVTNANF